MLRSVIELIKTVLIVVLATFVIFMFVQEKSTQNSSTIVYGNSDEIRVRVKSFIELDASFNSYEAIKNIESAKGYLTSECYDSMYTNNGKFMNYPENSDKPVVRFTEIVVEDLINYYNVIALWTEQLGDITYTYTGIITLEDDLRISSFRKIPHLR